MSDRWRCFVACPIGESLRAALADAIGGWARDPDLGELRWTDPGSWHVTLAFLGDIEAAGLAGVRATLERVAADHAPMRLGTGGLGAFPSRGRARVLWYGIADPGGRLEALARDLQQGLGIESGGAFRAHLTLARAKRAPVQVEGWMAAAAATAPDGELVIDRLDLMRSHLGRGPARYEIVASTSLGVVAHA